MNDRELALLEKLIDNQKGLIAAFAKANSTEEFSVLEAIAETQYVMAESMMSTQMVEFLPDNDLMTMQ